jgi:hypothetical protein
MKPTNVSTTAAVFDTNYSSPAVAPAKVQINQRNVLDAVYWMPKMSQLTKFVPAVPGLRARRRDENLLDFHGSKTNPSTSIY